MKRFLMSVALTCALQSLRSPEDAIVGAPSPASGGTQSSAVVTVLLTIISLVRG